VIGNRKEPSGSALQILMRKRWDFIRHKQSLCLRNEKEPFKCDLVNTKLAFFVGLWGVCCGGGWHTTHMEIHS